MTTSNSISVNPQARRLRLFSRDLFDLKCLSPVQIVAGSTVLLANLISIFLLDCKPWNRN